MNQIDMEHYKQQASKEIILLQNRLSEISTLFKNKFYIGSLMKFEVNDMDNNE